MLLLRPLYRRDTLTSVTGTGAPSIIDVWRRARKIRITTGNSVRVERRSQFRTIREMFAVARYNRISPAHDVKKTDFFFRSRMRWMKVKWRVYGLVNRPSEDNLSYTAEILRESDISLSSQLWDFYPIMQSINIEWLSRLVARNKRNPTITLSFRFRMSISWSIIERGKLKPRYPRFKRALRARWIVHLISGFFAIDYIPREEGGRKNGRFPPSI